jgi:hypothetical protein
MIQAARSSEMSVSIHQTTRRSIRKGTSSSYSSPWEPETHPPRVRATICHPRYDQTALLDSKTTWRLFGCLESCKTFERRRHLVRTLRKVTPRLTRDTVRNGDLRFTEHGRRATWGIKRKARDCLVRRQGAQVKATNASEGAVIISMYARKFWISDAVRFGHYDGRRLLRQPKRGKRRKKARAPVFKTWFCARGRRSRTNSVCSAHLNILNVPIRVLRPFQCLLIPVTQYFVPHIEKHNTIRCCFSGL